MGTVFFPTRGRRGWKGLFSLLKCDSFNTPGVGSLLGEISLFRLVTWVALTGVGLLVLGDGAEDLCRLSAPFLFGEDFLLLVRLLDLDLRGDRLLCLGQVLGLAFDLLVPLLESGVLDLQLFSFFDFFFFVSSLLLLGGEH